MIGNFTVNLNKLAQSQAFEMMKPSFHKSAPISPR